MAEITHTDHIEKPAGDEYGRRLRGLGINLLVRDVLATVGFLVEVMELEQVYSNPDFAILRHQGMELMLRIMTSCKFCSKLAVKTCDMACRNHPKNMEQFIERKVSKTSQFHCYSLYRLGRMS